MEIVFTTKPTPKFPIRKQTQIRTNSRGEKFRPKRFRRDFCVGNFLRRNFPKLSETIPKCKQTQVYEPENQLDSKNEHFFSSN